MSLPWMPLYIPDYLADTAHLCPQEHGAYLLLIMHYWMNGGLPDDDRQLARIARMNAGEWRRVRPVVATFFRDGWRHARIEDELRRVRLKSEARAAAGRAGGLATGRRYRRAAPVSPPPAIPRHQEDPDEGQGRSEYRAPSEYQATSAGEPSRRQTRSVQDAARALARRAGAARPEPAGDD
jgi:uncharacterized protein YdaU (DUF1376 family)